jgi:hypothetical protein
MLLILVLVVLGMSYSFLSHYVTFNAPLGRGTDNWAELHALLQLLQLATERSIVRLQVFLDLCRSRLKHC